MLQIQVWGDSVFKGVIFDKARGRYALLRDSAVTLLSAWLKTPIENQSRMGRTAPEGLKALKAQPAEGLKNRIVVLEYGGNDCDFDWKAVSDAPEEEHGPHTSAEQFVESMIKMVEYVRDCGGKPLLTTLPPLNCEKYLNWITRDGLSRERILRFLGAPERIYRYQEYYSSLILRISATMGCGCLPVREAFLEQMRGEEMLCEDGIHPNEAGHRLIARTALDYAKNAPVLA